MKKQMIPNISACTAATVKFELDEGGNLKITPGTIKKNNIAFKVIIIILGIL
jgi:hypothetical protein